MSGPQSSKFNDIFTTQNYNTNVNHPLTQNSQEYIFYKKYISIHSEDRDIIKYPNSSEFEIELPEDYLNVASLKLVDWSFPFNYTTFSLNNNNVFYVFKINEPYNPAEFGVDGDLVYKIYEILFTTVDDPYTIMIEEGFYDPLQISTELTNKFNYAVTKRIQDYLTNQGLNDLLTEFNDAGGYKRFAIVCNGVSLKLWFGNTADGFLLINSKTDFLDEYEKGISSCLPYNKYRLPDSSDYGMPTYLGLPPTNIQSINGDSLMVLPNPNLQTYNGIIVPRFYYGDVIPGDFGLWLLPDPALTGSLVYWVEAPYKVNLLGNTTMYMEVFGHNCMDETKPFNISNFTLTSNQTNGVANAAFAKFTVTPNQGAQFIDRNLIPYKIYYPPAERIRRLKFKIRYHNGQLANFGLYNYSFLLEFTLAVPQILRSSKTIVYPTTVL